MTQTIEEQVIAFFEEDHYDYHSYSMNAPKRCKVSGFIANIRNMGRFSFFVLIDKSYNKSRARYMNERKQMSFVVPNDLCLFKLNVGDCVEAIFYMNSNPNENTAHCESLVRKSILNIDEYWEQHGASILESNSDFFEIHKKEFLNSYDDLLDLKSPSLLKELFVRFGKDNAIRRFIGFNKNTPIELYERISELDIEQKVDYSGLIVNPNTPTNVLVNLCNNIKDQAAQLDIIRHENFPKDEKFAVMSSLLNGYDLIKVSLASNPEVYNEILHKLSLDKNEEVSLVAKKTMDDKNKKRKQEFFELHKKAELLYPNSISKQAFWIDDILGEIFAKISRKLQLVKMSPEEIKSVGSEFISLASSDHYFDKEYLLDYMHFLSDNYDKMHKKYFFFQAGLLNLFSNISQFCADEYSQKIISKLFRDLECKIDADESINQDGKNAEKKYVTRVKNNWILS